MLGNSNIHTVDEICINHENKNLFIDNYYLPRVPAVIKGGAKEWPLIKSWTDEYLIKEYGDYLCTVVNDSRPAYSKEKTTLKNYFKNHSEKSTLTLELYDKNISTYFIKDIILPNPLFSKETIARYFFFNSHEMAGTLPHFHGDAFNILQSGRKKWALYDCLPNVAPRGFLTVSESFKTYPPGTHAKAWFSNELPTLYKKVEKAYQCIQEPTDIVFIPFRFAHAVLNQSSVRGIAIENVKR